MSDKQLDIFLDAGAGASPTHSAALVVEIHATPPAAIDAHNVVALPVIRRRRTKVSGSVVPTVPFPLARRRAKVLDVATKLAATRTRRHAEFYRSQVTDALLVHLASRRVPAERWAGEIASFWRVVNIELARQQTPARRPGGGAA